MGGLWEAAKTSWTTCSTRRPGGIEAIIHLAGEGISDARWSAAKKARIRDSRVRGTERLCRSLAEPGTQGRKCSFPPRRSAFTATAATSCSTRIVRPAPVSGRSLPPVGSGHRAGRGLRRPRCACTDRAGVVTAGWSAGPFVPIFRLGLGGRLGSGRQYMSWITLDDLVGIVDRAIRDEGLQGPVNAVAPHPVTNREFVRTLGRVLVRPAFWRFRPSCCVPPPARWPTNCFFPAQVVPRHLVDRGFAFRDAELQPALARLLGRGPNS